MKNELKRQYQNVKKQAVKLMQKGNISAYLRKLQEIQELKTQMVKVSSK
ncbi:hypothetical protein [Halocola ammonii]